MRAKALVAFSLMMWSSQATACSGAEAGKRDEEWRPLRAVSIIRLVAGCERFEGEEVLTTGVLTVEFENHSLCPSLELADRDLTSCLEVESGDSAGIPVAELEALENWSGQFVNIEAVAGCVEDHHTYSGRLRAVKLILESATGEILWSKREFP